jgi:hypothetical protein
MLLHKAFLNRKLHGRKRVNLLLQIKNTSKIIFQKKIVLFLLYNYLFFRVEFEGAKTTLYIRGAKMTDAGWYQCTATSPAGTAITKCKVTVIRTYL